MCAAQGVAHQWQVTVSSSETVARHTRAGTQDAGETRAPWHRLYEQQKRKTAPESAAVLNAYVLRWQRSCKAGLGGLLDAFIGAEAATALRPTQGDTGQP